MAYHFRALPRKRILPINCGTGEEIKWHSRPLCGWKRCRLVEKRGSEGRVERLRETGDKWPWRRDDSVISETVTVTFIHISKRSDGKRAGIMRPWTCRQREREGKRGIINKWGAAGLVQASKVRGTFTPVPQGCRAAKAQLEIRSGGAVSLTVQWWPGWVTDGEEGAACLPQTASWGVRARHREKYQQWCNRGVRSCSIYSASLLFISDRLLYSSLHKRVCLCVH